MNCLQRYDGLAPSHTHTHYTTRISFLLDRVLQKKSEIKMDVEYRMRNGHQTMDDSGQK